MQTGYNLNKERTIYMITNKINNKKYVGMTINLDVRRKQHLYDLRKQIHVNKWLQKDFLVHGSESFEFKPLCKVKGWREALKKEKELIDKYETEKYGYNSPVHQLPEGERRVTISTSLKNKNKEKLLIHVKNHDTTIREWLYEAAIEKAEREGIHLNEND